MNESEPDQTDPAAEGKAPAIVARRRIVPPPMPASMSPPPAPQPAAVPPAAAPAPDPWLNKFAWPGFLALAFVYAMSVWVPWRSGFPSGDLDSSWIMALKWAHAHGVDFGHDFIFTFGPWGFAFQGYDPANFGVMIAVWTLFTVAFFAGLVALSGHMTKDRWIGGLWLLLVLFVAGGVPIQIIDVRLLAPCWMLLVLRLFVNKRSITPTQALLVVAMALAGQIKFSANLLAIMVLAVIIADDLRKRRIPWPAAIYAAAYLGFWLLAGQSLSSLPSYLRNSMALSAGYTEGASFSPPSETTDVLLFLACAISLLALDAVSQWRHWTAAGLSLAALAGCILLSFKSGYVRHDNHEWEGTVGLAVIALLWVAALWPTLRLAGQVLALIVLGGTLSLSWYSYTHWPPGDGLATQIYQTFAELPARAATAWSWVAGDCDQRKDYEKYVADTLQSRNLPPIQGSVDIYPWAQRLVIARGLDYQPRPVIQSYLAYSTELGELDAAHLRGDRAPDNILFEIGTIDGRYPSQDDALSWPLMLTRYDLKDLGGSLLLLQRAAKPREYQLKLLEEGSGHFRTEIPVPTDQMIWATFQVKKTLWGNLMEGIYKTPMVVITVRTRQGATAQGQLVPNIARGGFLLSPMVLSRQSFALLGSSTWQADLADGVVQSISLSAMTDSGESACFDSDFQYSLFSLDFPRTDLSAVPGVADYVGFRQFLSQTRTISAAINPRVTELAGLGTILLVPGKTQLLYPARASITSLHVGFGMLDQSFTGDTKTDGATFRIYGVRASGQGRVIFSRKLDPTPISADRGEQTADILIPPGTAALVLESDPVTPGGPNYIYWSKFRIH